MVEMSFEVGANNLVQEDLPVALETAGMEDSACRMRSINACEYARAAETLEVILKDAEEVLPPAKYELVSEFVFWALAALWAAVAGAEASFTYALARYKRAVDGWWSANLLQ